jgi:hypothetical protein
MDGVSWSFSDLHAITASAQAKTAALRIRKTGHVAEAVPMRLVVATSD